MRFLPCCGLALGLLLARDARAQNGPIPGRVDSYNRYQAITTVTGSSGTSLTIQQPASPSLTFILESITVRCSVACTAQVKENGTAATSTTLAPVAFNNSPLPQALAFSASNASGGTAFGTYYQDFAAGGTITIDASKWIISPVKGQQITVVTTGSSAGITIVIQWVEK